MKKSILKTLSKAPKRLVLKVERFNLKGRKKKANLDFEERLDVGGIKLRKF